MSHEAGPETERARLWQARLDHEEQLGVRRGRETDYPSFRLRATSWAMRWALKSAGLYDWGRVNARDPHLHPHTMRYANLSKALDGFTILLLADFHYPRLDAPFADAVLARLRGVQVDICCLAGDYRYGYYGEVDHVYDYLGQLLDQIHVRHGTYGILGNHDVSDLKEGLESLGVHMLVNEGTSVPHEDAKVWVGGTDDPHKFQTASVPLAMTDAPEAAFKILLAHSPECVKEAHKAGVDLYLCGHTHGGQIRLPVLGPVATNARCPRRFAAGPWQAGPMQGYTSPGLGVTNVPVRFNCRPEAILITLRPPLEE